MRRRSWEDDKKKLIRFAELLESVVKGKSTSRTPCNALKKAIFAKDFATALREANRMDKLVKHLKTLDCFITRDLVALLKKHQSTSDASVPLQVQQRSENGGRCSWEDDKGKLLDLVKRIDPILRKLRRITFLPPCVALKSAICEKDLATALQEAKKLLEETERKGNGSFIAFSILALLKKHQSASGASVPLQVQQRSENWWSRSWEEDKEKLLDLVKRIDPILRKLRRVTFLPPCVVLKSAICEKDLFTALQEAKKLVEETRREGSGFSIALSLLALLKKHQSVSEI